MNDIKIGSIVQLKSGYGPQMTARRILFPILLSVVVYFAFYFLFGFTLYVLIFTIGWTVTFFMIQLSKHTRTSPNTLR